MPSTTPNSLRTSASGASIMPQSSSSVLTRPRFCSSVSQANARINTDSQKRQQHEEQQHLAVPASNVQHRVRKPIAEQQRDDGGDRRQARRGSDDVADRVARVELREIAEAGCRNGDRQPQHLRQRIEVEEREQRKRRRQQQPVDPRGAIVGVHSTLPAVTLATQPRDRTPRAAGQRSSRSTTDASFGQESQTRDPGAGSVPLRQAGTTTCIAPMSVATRTW